MKTEVKKTKKQLYLSAAFDTIDHHILLTRLESNFGISGSALSLLSSYLHNRSQSVLIDNHSSSSAPLVTGVPQGSVLGPLLFCLYTRGDQKVRSLTLKYHP
jgi:hypothetical protein